MLGSFCEPLDAGTSTKTPHGIHHIELRSWYQWLSFFWNRQVFSNSHNQYRIHWWICVWYICLYIQLILAMLVPCRYLSYGNPTKNKIPTPKKNNTHFLSLRKLRLVNFVYISQEVNVSSSFQVDGMVAWRIIPGRIRDTWRPVTMVIIFVYGLGLWDLFHQMDSWKWFIFMVVILATWSTHISVLGWSSKLGGGAGGVGSGQIFDRQKVDRNESLKLTGQLGGGFKYFLFSPLFGEDSGFD